MDAQRLADGETPERLVSAPLWPDRPLEEFRDHWGLLRGWLGKEPHWQVWIDWYEARIAGEDWGEARECVFVDVPQEKWEEGPEAANLWIAQRLAELVPAFAKPLGEAPHSALGERFTGRGAHLVVAPSVDASDIAAAAEPLTRQLHAEIQRKAQKLARVSGGLEERLGWSDFESEVALYCEAIAGDTAALPERLGMVYSRTLSFGALIDQDNELRLRPSGNRSCLDPDARSALTDLIRTAAPWARRFPTIRQLDDDLGAALTRKDWFAPARAVTDSAGAKDLVVSIDARLLATLLAAHGRDGAMSDKAGAHGVASVRNLAAAALEILAAHYIGPGRAADAALLRKIVSVVIERETDIAALFSDAPDLRAALAEAVAHLRREPPDFAR